MKLRQLVYLNEVIARDFNISATAKALYTSQPGVSRQLQALSEELGVELFRHQGKRLIGLTEPGAEIAAHVADVLAGVARVRAVAEAHASGRRGGLTVVSTRHAATRHLSNAVARCRATLPGIEVQLCEEAPQRAATMLMAGEAHLGVLVESAERYSELGYFPLESWRLLLVLPRDHPVARLPEVSLAMLATWELCTYDRSAASRQVIDGSFLAQGLESPVAFSLGSSVQILEFVENGVALGIVGAAAFDPEAHPRLCGMSVDHLFRPLTTELVLPRRARLPEYVYDFARLMVPDISRDSVELAAC